MTSKLKCPFCKEELDTENYYVRCRNPHCNTTTEMEGTEEIWQALIQAKQDLEIARQALDEIANGTLAYPEVMARETLELIEHKDI